MAVTFTVTPNPIGDGGYESDGSIRVVTGTWTASGTYTGSGGDTFTVPGLTRQSHVMFSVSGPAASVAEAAYVSGKMKLITTAAEVANATSVTGLAGTFVAYGR